MKRRALLSAAVLAVLCTAAVGSCDVFRGRWVLDNSSSYPLYDDSARCPFVRRDLDCRCAGRPDELYLRHRWQPDPPCPPLLPRFDGRALLRVWTGRTIMFVGDSLVANQYESLLCMLHAAAAPGARSTVPPPPGSGKKKAGGASISRTVRFEDYNVTLVYLRTPYLVDIVREKVGRVLELDSMRDGRNWIGADVLVFGSWHWWPSSGPTQPWDYIQDGDRLTKDMDRTMAFTKALHTWATWVDANLAKTNIKVFFQGISPSHYRGQDWGASPRRTCRGETRKVKLNGTAPYPAGPVPQEAALRNVLLDITFLSQLRKDAHPGKYNGGGVDNDCSHWCVPGVPSTWNVLFYGALTAGH